MRNLFVQALSEIAAADERVVFLSGDLGFMALEPLRERLGKRFINAGVAEQNMVSLAAGMASQGYQPWVYSITPFITLRPFEQLRNDVCLHGLPVRVVGNGGGYGYGIMGATHHALEDIGAMKLLPKMCVLVPTFADDVRAAVAQAHAYTGPAYLRLGREIPGKCPDNQPVWRTVARGKKATVVTTGPVVGGLLDIFSEFGPDTFEVVSVAQFPHGDPPQEIVDKIQESGCLVTLEEHLPTGGLGESLAASLLGRLSRPVRFLSLSAQGYPSGRYGSQTWHLRESGLAGPALAKSLHRFLEASHG